MSNKSQILNYQFISNKSRIKKDKLYKKLDIEILNLKNGKNKKNKKKDETEKNPGETEWNWQNTRKIAQKMKKSWKSHNCFITWVGTCICRPLRAANWIYCRKLQIGFTANIWYLLYDACRHQTVQATRKRVPMSSPLLAWVFFHCLFFHFFHFWKMFQTSKNVQVKITFMYFIFFCRISIFVHFFKWS